MENVSNNHETYKPGEYLDFNMNGWMPKLVVECINSKYKIKQVRIFHEGLDIIQQSSHQIRPFRSSTVFKANIARVNLFKTHLRLQASQISKRVQQLEQFSQDLPKKTARDIIQFLRGKHYFYIEYLTSCKLIQSNYQVIFKYLSAHLKLFITYIKLFDYSNISTSNIYDSSMAALCSSYLEMINFTVFAAGCADLINSQGHDILNWYDSHHFVDSKTSWINNQLVEALSLSHYTDFSIDLIIELLRMLRVFVAKKRLKINAKNINILQNLYICGINKIKKNKQHQSKLPNYVKVAQSIFEVLYIQSKTEKQQWNIYLKQLNQQKQNNSESQSILNNKIQKILLLLSNKKAQTSIPVKSNIIVQEQFDKENKQIIQTSLAQNIKKQQNCIDQFVQDLQAIDYCILTANIGKDEFIKCKNVILGCYLLNIYKMYQLQARYTIQFQRISHQLKASLPKKSQNSFYNLFWTVISSYFTGNQFVQYFIETQKYIEHEQIQQIIQIVPNIIEHLLQKRKFKILSIILNFVPFKLDQIIKVTRFIDDLQIKKQHSGQDFIDFVIQFEKFLKSIIKSNQTKIQIEQSRSQVLWKLYRLAALLQKNDQLYDYILNTKDDDLKQKLWLEYMQSEVIGKSSQSLSIFHQYSLSKYAKKVGIKIGYFQQLCRAIISGDLSQVQIQTRKTVIIHSLHFIFRYRQDQYFKYLKIFIQYYTSLKSRNSSLEWINFHFFLADDDPPSFLTLSITEQQCQCMLQNLTPIRFEGDISLTYYLMLKLNQLKGIIRIHNDRIVSMSNIPVYLEILFKSLFLQLNHERKTLLQFAILRFFQSAQEPIYSGMLIIFLTEILNNKASQQIVSLFFNTIKSRIPFANKINDNDKNDEKYISFLYIQCQQKGDHMTEQSFYDQIKHYQRLTKHCNLKIDKNEPIISVIYRLAEIFNCQPQQIELIKEQQQVSYLDQDGQSGQNNIQFISHQIIVNCQIYHSFGYKFIDFFYRNHTTQQISTIPIKFTIKSSSSSLFQFITDNILKILQCLPASAPLIQAYDFLKEDWKTKSSLSVIQNQFVSIIQGKQLSEIYNISDILPNLLIKYCFCRLDTKKTGNLKFLLKFLSFVTTKQQLLKNAKIIYLIVSSMENKSMNPSPLLKQQVYLLIKSFLPGDFNHHQNYKKQWIQQIMTTTIYNYIKDKVYSIILQQSFAFQMFTLCPHYQLLKKYSILEKQYNQKWKQSYDHLKRQQQHVVFIYIAQNLMNFHKKTIQMIFSLPWHKLQQDVELKKQIVSTLIISLIKYTKLKTTYQQQKSIGALIIMINGIINKDVMSVVMQNWPQLKDYIKNNIYDFQITIQQALLKIIKMITIYSSSQNHQEFITFFLKQIIQTSWIKKKQTIQQADFQRDSKMQLHQRVGLRNPHSICYANSLIQQLFHLALFRKHLFTTKYKQNPNKIQDVVYQLKKIFLHLCLTRYPYFNSAFFKSIKGYSGDSLPIDTQMDVDQFRNLLFDRIQSMIPTQDNFMKKLFNGKQNSHIKSLQCNHISSKVQQFNSLCIEIKEKNSLNESLNSYFNSQILEKQNAYFCDQCNKKVKAQKHIQIIHLPQYLTFVLKRFQYKGYRRYKINSYFQFSIKQPLTYFKDYVYHLKGIIVHQGIPQAGHYFSYIKYNDIWYEFNDSYVHQISQADIMASTYGQQQTESNTQNRYQSSKNAYLLFYEKFKQPSQQIKEEIYEYYGIEQERKAIIQSKHLLKKQKIYFTKFFFNIITQMADQLNSSQSNLLLFYSLSIIYFKFTFKDGLASLKRPLMILKKNIHQLTQIWSENHLKLIVKILKSSILLSFKSIIIEILVSNCHRYNGNVQLIVKQFLIELYKQQEVSVCYMVLYAFAAKFQQSCQFLHKNMIILRIFDLSFPGLVAQQLKLKLKDFSQFPSQPIVLQGEESPPKHFIDNQFLYYKWSLLALVLSKNKSNLHREQEKMLFQSANKNIFKTIFIQAKNKPVMKYMSQFLCILCQMNKDFFNKLLVFVGDTMIMYKSEFLRFILKIFRDICFMQNGFQQRINGLVNMFLKMLRCFRDNNKSFCYLYTMLWLHKIIKTNVNFRINIKKYKTIFSFMQTITLKNLLFYKYTNQDQTYKYQKSFHPLYGLMLPTTFLDLQILFQMINQQIQYFFEEQSEQFLNNLEDDDGDIVNEHLKDKESLIIYHENLLRYYSGCAQFVFGDLVYLFVEKSIKENQSSYDFLFVNRGNERIRKRTSQIYDNHIMTIEQKLALQSSLSSPSSFSKSPKGNQMEDIKSSQTARKTKVIEIK